MWPDWLISILPQFPVLFVAGLVAWYAFQKVEKAYESQATLERELREKAIADLKIAVAGVQGEMKKLTKKVDDLIKRLVT
jgi:hypothetical protein